MIRGLSGVPDSRSFRTLQAFKQVPARRASASMALNLLIKVFTKSNMACRILQLLRIHFDEMPYKK